MQGRKKILWMTNKVIQKVLMETGSKVTPVNEGWIGQMFDQLSHENDVELTIVCCGHHQDMHGKTASFAWYTIRESFADEQEYSKEQMKKFQAILQDVSPDIVHIWGSEFPHTLAMVHACNELHIENTVISLQGIISQCALFYAAALPRWVIKRKTLFDRIRRTGVEAATMQFLHRGIYEINALQRVRNAIGRTEWDKSCVLSVNPDIRYFHCNETLRPVFYHQKWEYQKCQKHSIFVSQATYPLKGFHLLLSALPLIKKKYPDVQVSVAGQNITKVSDIKSRLKQTSYSEYLRQLIRENDLHANICFLGKTSAEEMLKQYLKANVFLCCSSLENSSNSVGEAMLVGTPVVASDVGGMRSIISSEDGLLYQWDNEQALANAVIEAFSNTEETIKKAENAKQHAEQTHDSSVNYSTLLKIYQDINDN